MCGGRVQHLPLSSSATTVAVAMFSLLSCFSDLSMRRSSSTSAAHHTLVGTSLLPTPCSCYVRCAAPRGQVRDAKVAESTLLFVVHGMGVGASNRGRGDVGGEDQVRRGVGRCCVPRRRILSNRSSRPGAARPGRTMPARISGISWALSPVAPKQGPK